MKVGDEIYYNELFAEYCELLSPAQKEIFDLYSGMDLSLGEIAEIKGISRQSVSDAISATRNKLSLCEEKLGLYAKKTALNALFDKSQNGSVAITDIKKALGEF